jgi:beta-N-acetylhexosaminidase
MPATLDARAASLLCVGFSGTRVPPELEALIARGVRGVVLFSRNVGSPEELAELILEIKALSPDPIGVAVDQEGGPVQRLRRGFTELPAMRALGASGDATLARAVGRLLARELRAVGIDWDFAPVLDVDRNPRNPVIGARALSSDPATVAALGVALAEGLQEGGVAACGKHFPGHGDTLLDSHRELPTLSHDLNRLDQVELVPFAAAAHAEVASLMTAHVVFTELDPEHPATLSQRVLADLLRQRLGFGGLVVSDDLEMRAILDHYGMADAAVRAVAAGVDLMLVCHSAERAHQAIDGLVAGVHEGRLSDAALDGARSRVLAFYRRWVAPAPGRAITADLNTPEHRLLAARLAAFGVEPGVRARSIGEQAPDSRVRGSG